MEKKDLKTDLDLDVKVLSDFIYALNIARRQVQSYPHGHPVITTAAENLRSEIKFLTIKIQFIEILRLIYLMQKSLH